MKFPFADMLFKAASQSLGKIEPPPIPRLLPPPADSGYVESFDGTQIYWERHGPAESKRTPMIFCYGLVCAMNQWRYQIERFSVDHTCFILDYRGHHKSASPVDPRLMNLSAIGKDVAAVLKLHQPDRATHIWGHSMGCNVALELALAEPQLCRSLILCCGTAGNPFENMFHTDSLNLLIQPLMKFYPNQKDLFNALGKILLGQYKMTSVVARIAGFNDKASLQIDSEAYAKAVANVNPRTFFPLLLEMAQGQSNNFVSKIDTPSLVVAGAKDMVTPVKAQKELHQRLHHSEYAEIPAGSHNVQVDFGEYVSMKAEDFWKRHGLE